MQMMATQLDRPINWLFHRDDPIIFSLSSPFDWLLLHPLLYPASPAHGTTRDTFIATQLDIAVTADEVLGYVNGLIFLLPDSEPNVADLLQRTKDAHVQGKVEGLSMSPEAYRHLSQAMWGHIGEQGDIERFLLRLRYVSRQANFPRMTAGFDYQQLTQTELEGSVNQSTDKNATVADAFPEITQGPSDPNIYISFGADRTATAVTAQHVLAAATMVDQDMQPADSILLDSINAWEHRDYRTALLYAAIASETMAATEIDRAHDTILRQGDPMNALRAISFKRPRGETVVKDPVFEDLRAKDSFAQLLHVLPLYVMRRSLLVDNETLYQNALKLYNTRNAIAHRGTLAGESAKAFAVLDKDSALDAIEIAIQLFAWFRGRRDFTSPRPREQRTRFRLSKDV